jgi:hypothetical protein
MPKPMLDELAHQLDKELDELCEQGRRQQRGGARIRARGAGAKDKLTTADRVLATMLYSRKFGTRYLLAQLFGVDGSTLTKGVHQVLSLLAEHDHTIESSIVRFRTPADVSVFLANSSPDQDQSDPLITCEPSEPATDSPGGTARQCAPALV